MNLVALTQSGLFDDGKWSCCLGRCRKKASYIRITKKGRTATFSGRCEKHNDEKCVTLKKLRKDVLGFDKRKVRGE